MASCWQGQCKPLGYMPAYHHHFQRDPHVTYAFVFMPAHLVDGSTGYRLWLGR